MHTTQRMTAFSVADDRFHAYCLGNFRVHTTERMTASMQACGHANVSVHAAQRFLCNTLRAEEERDHQQMDMEGVALATEILQEELQCTQVLAAASHSMHCICSGRPLSIHK